MNLILGDGLLGSELIKQTDWNYISRKKNGYDVKNFHEWSHNLMPYKTIINCIAYTNTYDMDKSRHWDINYKFVSQLVDFCNENGKKLIHISTDYVYTNSEKFANEDNTVPIHGNNWYSYTKLIADSYIELKCKDYIIIRESHKPYPFPYEFGWIDQTGNFDYVDKIATIIIKLINNKDIGIYNIGTELKTIYDLALITNKNIVGINKPKYAPSDISMDLTKINKII